MNSDSTNSTSDSKPSHRVFATTSWSMVLNAAEATGSDSSTVSDSLSDLCQMYWFPLYSFVRRKGFERSQAEDLTQSFFAGLLENDRIHHANPERGRFRTFLLASMNNFLANHWRAENAIKRGGGQKFLSIDYELANDLYIGLTSEELSAERMFEKNWALSILEQTLEQVASQYEESGKRELFESLRGFLTGNDIAYAELSLTTGMKEGALKVAVHRLRQRYGQQLRLQIAKTVEDPADVDQELNSLFRALE